MNSSTTNRFSELTTVEMQEVQGGALNFAAIKFEYKPQKEDGTLG